MIVLRNNDEIETIRRAGKILAATLNKLKKCAKIGITTAELDKVARDEILSAGAFPAFKDYKGYPGNICISLNEVVVHGIPSKRKLKDGDIVSFDVGVGLEGYFADAAITMGIGKISEQAGRLIDVTEKALYIGIDNAKVGNRVSDISCSVQNYVESNGFSVVRAFVGHGIGTRIHEEPEVPNYGRPGTGPRLDNGTILAIEPMVNAGSFEVDILNDGWAVVTRDRKLSAHFEHTIAVRNGGADILTK